MKASLLLCSKGQEAPEISDRLKSLTSAPEVIANVLATTCDTDIKGSLFVFWIVDVFLWFVKH